MTAESLSTGTSWTRSSGWPAGTSSRPAGTRSTKFPTSHSPGSECRHNLRYWRIDPYAGAGPGAVSTLPAEWAARAAGRPELAEHGQSVIRFTAPKNISAFLQGEKSFWGIETEVVEPADFLLECVMMGLRLAGGIPKPSCSPVSAVAFPTSSRGSGRDGLSAD